MKIDLAMLRGLEREREIPFEELAEIIEQAIQTAYVRHAENQALPVPATEDVRVTLDRKNGEISVLVPEHDDEGNTIGEAYVTTDEFGRVASSAAKQVINQRLRDLSDDAVLGQFKDKEGQVVSGVIQQGPNPRMVHVDLGEVEGIIPPEEQIPGEEYPHGSRVRVYVTSVSKGLKGPQIVLSRTHPASCGSCSNVRFPSSVRASSRSFRSPARQVTAQRSPCARSKLGLTRRAPASVRWVAACAPS